MRERLKSIISIKGDPRRLSFAFALGVFIGMSPLIGAHTILGLAAASVLRLNMPVTMTGVYITNPWTIIPIYTFCTWFGSKCLGMSSIIPEIDWTGMTLMNLANDMMPVLKPFVLGTLLIGFISSVASYFLLYSFFKRKR